MLSVLYKFNVFVDLDINTGGFIALISVLNFCFSISFGASLMASNYLMPALITDIPNNMYSICIAFNQTNDVLSYFSFTPAMERGEHGFEQSHPGDHRF